MSEIEQARRSIADIELHIAHERKVIAQKERDGHDTATSKQLLSQFEQDYATLVAVRDRLEKELAAPPGH
jgi:hypothetical protein